MFWQEFLVLFALALVGAAAVVPYGLKMAGNKPLPFSRTVVLLLSLAQNAVIFAAVIWLGLRAAHSVGYGAPYIEGMLAGTHLPGASGGIGVITGIIAGVVLLVADLFFLPYWPQKLREVSLSTTALENFAASLYGGINEELLIRLFLFSALVRLWSFVAPVSVAVLWVINIITTVLFGLGHLPALKQILGNIPRIMLIRSLFLNAPIGLACGWLFSNYGLESAILAHFFADIVYHVIGTFVLRAKTKAA